ncbi:MAG: ROK family protein, partial [Chloroflexota bacterium]
MPGARYIGIDLGGTLVRAALGDAAGQVLHRADAATHAERGEAAIVDGIAALVRQAANGTRLADVAAVALGAPGPVDPVSGTLYDAPNLVKGEFRIKAMLEQRLE